MRPCGRITIASFHSLTGDDMSYPLRLSTILDSGSTVDVFNDRTRFRNFSVAVHGDFVWSGDAKVPIHGTGDVIIPVYITPTSLRSGSDVSRRPTRTLRIREAVYCPTFLCNIVSLRNLRRRGFWWDNRCTPTILRRLDDTAVAELQDIHGQFVLHHVPAQETDFSYGAFPTQKQPRRQHQNSRTPVRQRRPRATLADIWHLRLGHPNVEALMHLVNHTTGARIRGPTTVQCDQCGTTKVKRKVDRSPRDESKPGQRVAIDFHDFELAYEKSRYLLLITDRCTGMMWDYYLSDRSAPSIIKCLQHFINMVAVQYDEKVKVIECDNEMFTRKLEIKKFFESESRKINPLAPYI